MKTDYWQKFGEEGFYHLYNHAAGDKNIFIKDEDYNSFLIGHHKYLDCVFDTIAYCLMPNHFHFIIKVKPLELIIANSKFEKSKAATKLQNEEIEVNSFILDQYRRFLSSFALSYNHRHQTKGQLFLKKFKRVVLDVDSKLLYLIAYVHHNPIHHNFVNNFELWKYSSYSGFTAKQTNKHYSNLIKMLFENIDEFHDFHNSFKSNFKESSILDIKS